MYHTDQEFQNNDRIFEQYCKKYFPTYIQYKEEESWKIFYYNVCDLQFCADNFAFIIQNNNVPMFKLAMKIFGTNIYIPNEVLQNCIHRYQYEIFYELITNFICDVNLTTQVYLINTWPLIEVQKYEKIFTDVQLLNFYNLKRLDIFEFLLTLPMYENLTYDDYKNIANRCCKEGALEICKYLLELQIRPDEINYCVYNGHLKMAEYLYENGYFKNLDFKYPYFTKISETCKFLTKIGATIDVNLLCAYAKLEELPSSPNKEGMIVALKYQNYELFKTLYSSFGSTKEINNCFIPDMYIIYWLTHQGHVWTREFANIQTVNFHKKSLKYLQTFGILPTFEAANVCVAECHSGNVLVTLDMLNWLAARYVFPTRDVYLLDLHSSVREWCIWRAV